MKKIYISTLLILVGFVLRAQQSYMPLNNDVSSWYDAELNKYGSNFHTSVKPYRLVEVNTFIKTDSLIEKELYFNENYNKYRLYRKVRKENLIDVKDGDFAFTVDPLFNVEMGRDLATDTATHVNGRGFQIQGSVGDKFSFSTTFYENQGVFVPYLDGFIRKHRVVPGQGFKRDFRNGFDYGMAFGYLSYTPSKYFNFQFGHDKNFIGDGYRSLLLSDNSFNYPFFKITSTIWKIKYVNLWAQMQDFSGAIFQGAGNHVPKKYVSTHYLSYNISKRISVGLFETIVSADTDTLGYRGLDFNYINPIIFYRPVEFSLGSPDNVLLGLNGKIKVGKYSSLYGQIILDEFKLSEIKANTGWYANKYGIQMGLKSFNLFTVPNLFFQGEFNTVRPFTYSEAIPIINYAHYNQPLAHPLGSNFKEALANVRYRYKSFYASLKVIYSIHGVDTAGLNFGSNLYKPYLTRYQLYGNYIGQGLKKSTQLQDFRIGYIVNPKTNLNIEVGFSNRSESDVNGTNNTRFVYFGLRTSLTNFYYDF